MSQLTDFKLHTKLKLSLLWASTVLCYIYCDYFELYVPGKLEGMLQGRGLFGDVTQGALLGASALLAIPSVLVFLSAALSPRASRLLNIIFGVIYTLMMILLAIQAGWYFYKFFAALEALLTAMVVWYAWTWPRAPSKPG
ncbi:MAG: DUF6326 family protein [Rhodanobacteraceae bacterium]